MNERKLVRERETIYSETINNHNNNIGPQRAKEQILKQEDKRRRDIEARERAEREKAEKAERDTRQRALHDVTNDQSNTEVMDQLVQLINTGQAFDVVGAGRRRRPGKTTGECSSCLESWVRLGQVRSG